MTELEKAVERILDNLESGTMVAQHQSESSIAVEGYLQRNHNEAKQAIIDLIDAYTKQQVAHELQYHIHPHAIWYKDLGSVRDTQSVADRIKTLKGDNHE